MHSVWIALAIGFATGLRALTGPAVVAWAARLGWLPLQGTPFAFMCALPTTIVFTVAALAEYVNDLIPKTPNRISPGPLVARIVSGGLCGACIAAGAQSPWAVGALAGAVGAVAGAFAGYNARVGLVRRLRVPDPVIAIPEDLVAIAFAFACVAPR
jgi:uncharacterized membrane protein